MHQLAVGAAAARAVGVERGVHALILSLAGLAVDLDIIHRHVTIGGVIGEVHPDLAGQAGRGRVILQGRGQRPGLDDGAADLQINRFLATGAVGTDHDRIAAAAGGAGARGAA